jgi:Phage integrase, N-terminal SAM-like domain
MCPEQGLGCQGLAAELRPPTGHVFRVERTRGPVWYMKYRLPDGRQVQKKLGPAWTGRTRPPAGYFTKRAAEHALRSVLDEARRGTLPGLVRTGATFADAAAEYLRHAEADRGCKPSTLRDYRSNLEAHLLPAFGPERLEAITPASIDRWRGSLSGLSNRTKNKLLVVMHGVMRRAQHVWGLPSNPVTSVERHPQRSLERHPQRSSDDIDVFSPEEVWALVRAAPSEQDGTIFLTAAFTGLRRGELLALRWRAVDFAGSGDSRARQLCRRDVGRLQSPGSLSGRKRERGRSEPRRDVRPAFEFCGA